MYESFYQLTSNPFRLTPDPNFCFSHSGYKRAREHLEYALDQGEGFVMVTGRPGTGKTMLVETFLGDIDTSKVIAKRIAVSNYGAEGLLRAVAYAYGFDAAGMDKATLRHRIQQYFLQQEQAGRRVLLIIDEAQTLQYTALEELRLLADLQTRSCQMLQLFLVGQESLQDLMRTPDMEQFQQRVIANFNLVPLNLMDARAYMEYRLLQAGWNGDPEFTSAAVLSVYQLSKGVPRHINKICNRLMLLGFGKGSYIFHKADVQEISAEMCDEQLTPMEDNRTLPADFDSINSVPEIHDGMLSLADLAIRMDKVDASTLAISKASRLAAKQKARFIVRHHDHSAAWNQPQSSSASVVEDAAAVKIEQASGTRITASDIRHFGCAVAERIPGHFKRREALVVTAAALAITTLSFVVLPLLLGNVPAQDALSHTDHPFRESQDLNASVSHRPPGDDVIMVASTAPLAVRTPVAAEGEQVVMHDMHGDVLVAAGELADTQVSGDAVPVSVDTAGFNNNTVSTQQPLIESQPPVGEVNELSSQEQDRQTMLVASDETAAVIAMPGQYETVDDDTVAGNLSEETHVTSQQHLFVAGVHHVEADLQPAYGDINRHSSLQQPLPVTAGSVQAAASAEISGATDVIRDEAIAELLALAQQSINDYRLLTPEDDNAYGYFQEVLGLDPVNEDAHAGIQEIVDRYIILTRKAINRYDHYRAGRYVDRGLSIQPGNHELLALKDGIDSYMNTASTRAARDARHVPASQGSESAREQAMHERIMSRITSFFNKRKAEAGTGEVKIPSGWDG